MDVIYIAVSAMENGNGIVCVAKECDAENRKGGRGRL